MTEDIGNPLGLTNPGLFRSQAYIDGVWVGADDGATFDVSNPADAELSLSSRQVSIF